MTPLLLLLACQRGGREEEEALCAGEAALEAAGEGLVLAQPGCATLELSPLIVGEGAMALDWQDAEGGLQPVITAGAGGATFRGLALTGPLTLAGAAAPRLWRQGYQSWWWSGVTELSALTLNEDGLPLAGGDTSGSAATDETAFSSWWAGLLGRPGGASLLIGALSAEKTKFYTAFSEDEAWAVWGDRGEAIALAEGEALALDPIVALAGAESWELWRAYAAAVAEAHDLAPPAEPPPVGWSSWTVSYEDLDEETVRSNLAAAVALNAAGAHAPLDLLQIDDGWEVAWGDWTANERFPSGMAAVAAEIADAGLRPGLWLAPFYVEASTGLPDAHPDWFVLDFDGDPLSYSNFGGHDYRVLDVSQPDAAAWLAAQIRGVVDQGFTYLKLDFLYAGAQEGLRAADLTGAEALALGMALLREAAGPDTWILACGAPMLPMVGQVQSFRTGADIAFNFDPDPRAEYLRWQARATAARGWQNGLWWWVDPDSVMVRAPFGLSEASGAAAANAASGGAWLLGDDLGSLDADRLDLAVNAEVVALRGQAVRPLDPLDWPSGLDIGPLGELARPDDQVPTRWQMEDGAVVLLNLSADSVTVEGPGGRELLSGATAAAGARTLAPGAGEIWRPDP